MNLSELFLKLIDFDHIPVKVAIITRDNDGNYISKKIVDIAHIKPNYDGQGILIKIEQADIDSENI